MAQSLMHATKAVKSSDASLLSLPRTYNASRRLRIAATLPFGTPASPAVGTGQVRGQLFCSSSRGVINRVTYFMPPRSSSAASRLSLISRHIDEKSSFPPLNTPYSTERFSPSDDSLPYTPLVRSPPRPTTKRTISSTSTKSAKMSTQAEHPTLFIPGPIEISDEVAGAMGTFAQSHVGQPFVNVFGEALTMTRKLFQTTNPGSQPFILAGSGTLGWDLVAANLVEPGEDVLVLHTGYFGDSFADCFKIYGAKPTQLKAPIGSRPQLPEIEKALKEKKYKMITVTHVDTSTGVLSQVEPLAKLVKEVSPDTLLCVDGVCSIGAENLEFDKWGVDVVLTASQKAIGCPPGLSIMMVSEKAMNVFKSRKSPPGSYYASFKNWQPIMQNYEAKKPSYFATPPTQLIHALHTALTQLLSQPISQRFEQHKKVSAKVKAAVAELGLKQLASDPADQASAMTAIYLPEGLTPPEILPSLMKKGVVFAGGLHKEIATKYIRIGHMGVSVMDEGRGDIDKAIAALKGSLADIQKAKGQ
jgi:alanine-glyoxylate transaminase / serine-glyoxylate transaminase / serine-pyruvate transaminase